MAHLSWRPLSIPGPWLVSKLGGIAALKWKHDKQRMLVQDSYTLTNTHTHTRKSTASSYEHVPRIINWNWECPLCMLNTKNQPTLYKIALLVSKCECKVFLSIKHYGMDNSVYNYHNSIFRVKWPKFHDWRCNFTRTDPHEGARAHYESGIIIYKLSGTNWGGFSSIPTNGHRQCKQIGSSSKKTHCYWPRYS